MRKVDDGEKREEKKEKRKKEKNSEYRSAAQVIISFQ